MSLSFNPIWHLTSIVRFLGNGLESIAYAAGGYVSEPNTKTAAKVQGILSPWMNVAGNCLNTIVRRQLVALPKELDALMEGIKTLLSKANPKNVEELVHIVVELELESSAIPLIQGRFPALKRGDIQKLKQLPAALKQCQENPTRLSSKTRTLLTEVRDICINYDMANKGKTVCQVLVDDFNKHINSTVAPQVRQVLEDFDALLELEPDASQQQWRNACTRTSRHLANLNRHCVRFNRSQAAEARTLIESLYKNSGSREQIKRGVRKVRKSIKTAFDAQHGFIETTGDSLKGVLHGLASELVVVFRRTMGQMLSDGAEIAQSAMRGEEPRLPPFDTSSFSRSRTSSDEAPPPSPATFGGLMPILKNVKNLFSKQALSGLSIALQYSLKFLKNHLQCNIPQRAHTIKQTIDTSIESLEGAQTSDEIIDAVKECFNALSPHEVYVQNVRLPIKNSGRPSVAPNLLKLARTLEEQKDEPEITRDKVDEMATRFEQRSSSFIALKIIEKVCGVTLSGPESAQLLDMKSEASPSSYPKELQARFFVFLNKSPVNFLARWGAKCLYVISYSFVHLFVHSAMESIKIDFAGWQKKDTSAKGKDIIRFGRHVFSVISGTYTSVSQTPAEREKDIFTLLNEAVKAPSRNAGLPPDKFYAAIVTTAMKFVRFNWTQNIEGFFNRPLISPTSKIAFCAPLVNLLGAFCNKGLQAIVYVPQKICSFVLQKTTSLIIKKTVKPHTLIDTYIDQVRDPRTPTSFELHKWVEFKLRKITERVRETFADTSDTPELMPTSDQQLEIATCLKSVLEVLHKSRKYTVDELRQYAGSDRTVLERVQREVQEYILPEARLPISQAIYTALEEALTEQSLLEVQYSLLNIGNGMFNEQVTVTESEFRAVDKGIEDVADELLDEIIKTILKEKLDLNNAIQQKEISKFTGKFKQQTEKFVKDFGEYQATLADKNAEYTEKTQALKDLKALTCQFIYQEVDAQGKVGLNRHLHRGTKSQLNETMHGLKTRLEPIAVLLNEMKEIDEEIKADIRTEEAFQGIRGSLDDLQAYHGDPENNPMFEGRLDQLEEHLAHLQNVDIPGIDPLVQAQEVLTKKHAKLKRLKGALDSIQTTENQWNIFYKLKEKNLDVNTNELNKAYRQLSKSICELPCKKTLIDLLTEALGASSATELIEINETFNSNFDTLRNRAEEEMQKIHGELNEHTQKMTELIDDSHIPTDRIAENQELLLEKNQNLQERLNELDEWKEENVEEITIVNFNFIPYMEWVQDSVHSLAKSQALKVVGEIRDVLIQPQFYTCAINQMGVSFLEAYGSEHIRKS